jgi:type IV secretory pathway component VirB8
MTEKKEDLNPSKRTQIIEEPLESGIEKYQKLYEAQYKETTHWHTKEYAMEKKRNEWRFLSLLLIMIILTFSVIILRHLV